VEDDVLFPNFKSSDVYNGNVSAPRSHLILPFKSNENLVTDLEVNYPKTFQYFMNRRPAFAARKSSIYKGNAFSFFGIGNYTFKPYKIAISGMYRQPKFTFWDANADPNSLFDDTVYYLSFESITKAESAFKALSSVASIAFINSLLFVHNKRPITKKLLETLDYERVTMPVAAYSLF